MLPTADIWRSCKGCRAAGCPWNAGTCRFAVDKGHVEVLRWARENGCPWTAGTRDRAAAELGYTDNLGNVVDWFGNPILSGTV